ncbi:MAG: formylglycine-generating enzyme family protein, partial [Planctomycetes bacterium]|nr:formylglycine-generating enzyme family protein [Planctomycetota bacterium]
MEERFCPAFAALPPERRARLLGAIRAWRFDFSDSPEVWFQEVLNLDAGSQAIVESLFPGDLEDAISGLQHLATLAKPKGDSRFSLRLREYGGRAADWLSESAWRNPRIRQALHDLWSAAPGEARREKGGLDPALLGGQGEPVCVTLAQAGCDFRFSARQQGATSFVAPLWTRNGWIGLASVALDKNSFWKSGTPPVWAADWGRDRYGAWATIEIEKTEREAASAGQDEAARVVVQRLRWMPPGTFLMGSPESEAGRWADEGPQHEVTFTHGFWIFDTPVTQELWRAVTGKNPSHFKGDHRPVETVSWDDVQRFLDRLNERMGGAVFVLPSEAQWEYACRAGTTTAYAFGDDPA